MVGVADADAARGLGRRDPLAARVKTCDSDGVGVHNVGSGVEIDVEASGDDAAVSVVDNLKHTTCASSSSRFSSSTH